MLKDEVLTALHHGHVLAGQLRAVRVEHTAWVGIYPLDVDSPQPRTRVYSNGVEIPPGPSLRAYRIRLFEVADAVRDTWFDEDALKRKQSVVAVGDEQFLRELERLCVPLDVLDLASRIDYPL